MSVCSQRTDTPGFFTTLPRLLRGEPCRCGEEVKAEEEGK